MGLETSSLLTTSTEQRRQYRKKKTVFLALRYEVEKDKSFKDEPYALKSFSWKQNICFFNFLRPRGGPCNVPFPLPHCHPYGCTCCVRYVLFFAQRSTTLHPSYWISGEWGTTSWCTSKSWWKNLQFSGFNNVDYVVQVPVKFLVDLIVLSVFTNLI